MPNITELTPPECEPDPDIAGPGILISCSRAALTTLAFSTLAFWSQKLRRRPVSGRSAYIEANRPYWLTRAIKAAESLALSQLVIANALLVSVLINYWTKSKDPHATFAVLLSSLAVASTLQTLVTSKSTTKRLLIDGLVVCIMVFFVFLVFFRETQGFVHFFVSINLTGYILKYLGTRFRPQILSLVEFRMLMTFDTILGTVGCVAVLFQGKYGKLHNEFSEPCSLNTPEDNRWSFGQTVAVIVMVIPVLDFLVSAFDTRPVDDAADDIPMTYAMSKIHDSKIYRMIANHGDAT